MYNLRVKEFTIPRFNSIHYGKHSLRYLGPMLWAKLPSRVRTLQSLADFKRAVRGLDLEMLMDDSGCVTHDSQIIPPPSPRLLSRVNLGALA